MIRTQTARYWNRRVNKKHDLKKSARLSMQGLFVEQLEERMTPSITPIPDFAHNSVAFSGDPGDNLHLRVVSGQLQYSPDGVTFSADMDPVTAGVQTFTVTSGSKISTNGAGPPSSTA